MGKQSIMKPIIVFISLVSDKKNSFSVSKILTPNRYIHAVNTFLYIFYDKNNRDYLFLFFYK